MTDPRSTTRGKAAPSRKLSCMLLTLGLVASTSCATLISEPVLVRDFQAEPSTAAFGLDPAEASYQLRWVGQKTYVQGEAIQLTAWPVEALDPNDRLQVKVWDNGLLTLTDLALVVDQRFVVETSGWPELAAEQERVVTLTGTRPDSLTNQASLDQGRQVAFVELALGGAFQYSVEPSELELEITEMDGKTVLKSGGVTATFDDATGSLVSYQKDGVESLASPMRPNFWRPGSEAEQAAPAASVLARWKSAMSDSRATIRTLGEAGERVFLGYDLELGLHKGAPRGTVQLAWFMARGGSLELNFNLHPSTLPDGSPGEIPQVGMAFDLDRSLDQWSWYGRGPEPNTVDDLGRARWGQYTINVPAKGAEGPRTVEGTRSGIRSTTFSSKQGHGLSFTIPYASVGSGGFEARTYAQSWRELLGNSAAAGIFAVSLDVVSIGDLANDRPERMRLFGNREYHYVLLLEIL
ncbi:MAG: hypothetical protein ACI9C2_002400 [Gammaproteobacteria bacterium]|jgi:hypothetical protein